MDHDLKLKIDDACRAADEFTKIYYETFDKRRHLASKYYLDTAVMVWNGNGVNGKDSIHKLFMELPASEFTLTSVDSQPIKDAPVGNQLTILILTAGFATFQGKVGVPFQQNFMITAEGDKWKIASDCFRFQEVVQMPVESKAKF